MFCSQCGKEAVQNAKFCAECGAALGSAARQTSASKSAVNTSQIFENVKQAAAKMPDVMSRTVTTPTVTIPKFTLSLKHILAGLGGLLALFLIISHFGGGSGGISSNPKKAVAQTVEQFGDDLNDCLDFSVFIEGDNLDFSPVKKYFDSSSAYAAIDEIESGFNAMFKPFQHLNFGSSLAGSLTSSVLSKIPIFGEALGDMTKKEIENDSLLDPEEWASMASVKATASNIEVDDGGESATATVKLAFKIDPSQFKNSKILKRLTFGSIADFASERMDETFSITAKMEKLPSGEWVFTGFKAK